MPRKSKPQVRASVVTVYRSGPSGPVQVPPAVSVVPAPVAPPAPVVFPETRISTLETLRQKRHEYVGLYPLASDTAEQAWIRFELEQLDTAISALTNPVPPAPPAPPVVVLTNGVAPRPAPEPRKPTVPEQVTNPVPPAPPAPRPEYVTPPRPVTILKGAPEKREDECVAKRTALEKAKAKAADTLALETAKVAVAAARRELAEEQAYRAVQKERKAAASNKDKDGRIGQLIRDSMSREHFLKLAIKEAVAAQKAAKAQLDTHKVSRKSK